MSLVSSFGLPPIATEIVVNYAGVGPAMARAGMEIDREARKITNKFDNMANQGAKLSKLGSDLTKFVSIPTAALGGVAAKAAIEYESAFAGVRKTVDATEEEFKVLSDGIREMAKELPATATDIAGVAEAAGQLGIQKENLLAFTRSMVDLGEATNMTSEEAATTLARFANITGMDQTKFSNLGSSIVELGNNYATTEKEIAEMALRLAGAGRQAKMSEGDIMGIATALSSVGIEAAAGGSSMSKFIIDMQSTVEGAIPSYNNLNDQLKLIGSSYGQLEAAVLGKNNKALEAMAKAMGTSAKDLKDSYKEVEDALGSLGTYAEVANMTQQEFVDLFEKDAASAVGAFITGLKDIETNGGSVLGLLEEMGIEEVRMRDALLRATGASEMFNSALSDGNKAFEENTALAKEAEQRYKTTESQLKIFKNKVVDLGISFGEKLLPHLITLVDKGTELVEWFGSLDDGAQKTILKMGGLAIALGPVTSLFGGVLTTVSKVPKAFKLLNDGLGLLGVGSKLAVPAVAGVAEATTAVGTAAATAGGTAGVGALSTGLGGAIAAAAPFVAGAAVVAGGAYLVHEAVTQKATPAVDKLADGYIVTGETMTEVAGEMVMVQEKTAVKISEETKKQMASYYELSDGAQQATMEMYAGIVTVTDENVKRITNDVDSMANQTKSAIDSQKNKTISDFQEMFSRSTALTAEEKTQVLASVEEMAEDRKGKVERMRDRILELYEEIKTKGVANASEEKSELDRLYQGMAEEQIRAVTQSKNEQEVLINNLKDNAGQITSKMVEDAISKMNKKRDESIAAAEEEYEESIRIATQWKTDLEMSQGQMTDNQKKAFDKMIADAERLRKESTAEYENLRNGGIKQLYDAYPELTSQIDIETGKQLSFLDKLLGGAKKNANNINALQYEDKEYTITRRNRTINETITISDPNRKNRVKDYWLNPNSSTMRYGLRSSGLDFVPYDGFKAHLHRGERVLTAEENKKYSNGSGDGLTINIEKVENNTKEDVRKLVRRIGEEVKRQRLGKGGV